MCETCKRCTDALPPPRNRPDQPGGGAGCVAESIAAALPAEIVQARAGSWGTVALQGHTDQVHVVQGALNEQSGEAIVALCKSGTGCGGNRPSAPLWFHSTRFGSFSTLGEMDINSKMSGDPRQGRDFGRGSRWVLHGEHTALRSYLARGEQKVVAVYRDPRIKSDDEKGTRYTHACEQWQRRAFRWSPYSTSTVCGLRVMVALALALALARQLDFSTRVRVRWHKVDTSKPLFPP